MAQKGLTIGYTCNVRPKDKLDDELFGEWESPATIEAITKALEKTGNKVLLIDADAEVYRMLARLKGEIDIVFNNAEGFHEVELREAIVPFYCEMLGMPHTGSGPQNLINTMDKPTAKKILSYHGIPTPAFQVMRRSDTRLHPGLKFPLMVKPISEGTSIGISQQSKVHDRESLERQVNLITSQHHQPALVEEFIGGTEYTVGIIGNDIFPILKVPFQDIPGKPAIRDPHIKDIENPYIQVMPFKEPGYRTLARMTAVAFEALKCQDYCRMDWREKNGTFHFLEMNPLPGIHPTEADLTNMARHAGITHEEMINMILMEAIHRYRRNAALIKRFHATRIEGIADNVRQTKRHLEFYKPKIEDKDCNLVYRLVRPRGDA